MTTELHNVKSTDVRATQQGLCVIVEQDDGVTQVLHASRDTWSKLMNQLVVRLEVPPE